MLARSLVFATRTATLARTTQWGEHEPEHRAQLDELFSELLKRSERKPELMQQAQQKRELGKQAYKLGLECERRLKKNGYTIEFEEWFKKQTDLKDSISYYLGL